MSKLFAITVRIRRPDRIISHWENHTIQQEAESVVRAMGEVKRRFQAQGFVVDNNMIASEIKNDKESEVGGESS